MMHGPRIKKIRIFFVNTQLFLYHFFRFSGITETLKISYVGDNKENKVIQLLSASNKSINILDR
jgi:hypothetical protein